MKKMAGLFLAAFAAVVFGGCTPEPVVTGAFYSAQDQIVYQGPVASGDVFTAAGGAELRIEGVKPSAVKVRPLAEISSDKGGLEVGLTLGAIATVAIVTIATWPLWGDGNGSGEGGFDYSIPALSQDVRVEVGKRFYFDILRGDDEPQTAVVPNLAGLTQTQAVSAITATCLVVGSVTQAFSATVPSGTVVSWSPQGRQTCNTVINLVVSKGPRPAETATVPDLSGLTESQAVTAINATCLVAGTVTEAHSSTVPKGRVLSWTPTGEQPCGTIINLVVSKGPESVATLAVTMTSPVDGVVVAVGGAVRVRAEISGPNPVAVTVVSPEGEVYRQTVTPSASVECSFTLTIPGPGLVSVQAKDTVTGETVTRTRSVVTSL